MTGLAAEPAGAVPSEPGGVPLELGPAAWNCALEIAAAVSAAPPAAEPSAVPPVVVAVGGAVEDAAAAAAEAAAVAALDAGGGEELPDTGNWAPVDPASEALLAAALRAGFEASLFIAAAKSLPLVLCAEESA